MLTGHQFKDENVHVKHGWAILHTRRAAFEKSLKPRAALIGRVKKGLGLHARRCPISPGHSGRSSKNRKKGLRLDSR